MISRFTAFLGCALVLSGCASPSWMPSFDTSWMTSGGSRGPSGNALRLDSDPQGAEARTSLGPTCRTPCSMQLPASNDFTVTFTLPGFVPQSVPVEVGRPRSGMADPDASAPPLFSPDPVEVALEPAPPPAVAKRKPSRQRQAPPRQSSPS